MRHRMPTQRQQDNALLDEVGYDVVEARVEQIRQGLIEKKDPTAAAPTSLEASAQKLLASELGVHQYTLSVWMKRKRTVAFLNAVNPDEVLDMFAGGLDVSGVALHFGISSLVLETWCKRHLSGEEWAIAREHAADSRFQSVRDGIEDALDELELKRQAALLGVDKIHAAGHTNRYSLDRTGKVNLGTGTTMHISFTRTPDAEPASE